jgi:small subunit ribosomal protein S3
MIERKFVQEKKKEFEIQEYITNTLRNVGHSKTELVKTPLGDKVIVHASRPGLVVGKKGENIKKITATLKKKFKLENPEVEIKEVEQPNLDATIVAERIAGTIERFGVKRFKATAHRAMTDVLRSGALGIEIILSGRIPSSRAKNWRFYKGYIKKCGDVSIEGMRTAIAHAVLKQGKIGVKVSIMPPDIVLPDKIKVPSPITAEKAKETTEEKVDQKAEEKKTEEAEVKTEKPAEETKKE